MANTPVNWDGSGRLTLVPAVGSFLPVCMFSATVSGTTTSETITFPNLTVIKGAIIQVLDSGDRVATSDIDVTWSGNVLTLADGGSFDLDASGQVIYGTIWGTARA